VAEAGVPDTFRAAAKLLRATAGRTGAIVDEQPLTDDGAVERVSADIEIELGRRPANDRRVADVEVRLAEPLRAGPE
jgi:hypothetical protein